MVAIELAYINTKHPDFHKDAELVSLMMKSAEEDEFSRQRMLRRYNNTVNGCDRDVSNTNNSSSVIAKKFKNNKSNFKLGTVIIQSLYLNRRA